MADTDPATNPQKSYEASVREAMRALAENPGEYVDVINALRQGKPASVILKELAEATEEASVDLEAVTPAIKETTQALRAGVHTSEFQMSSGVNRILTVMAILFPILEAFAEVYGRPAGGAPGQFGDSMWVSGALLMMKTYLTQRYVSLRENLKKAAISSTLRVE